MTTWIWILAAGVATFATKLLGHLVPKRWFAGARVSRVAASVTVGLLASLTVVNTVATGQHLAFDARLGSLAAAAVALLLRAPFIVVVIVGAVAAAGLRLLGVA